MLHSPSLWPPCSQPSSTSERGTLAILDTTLEVTIRALLVEFPELKVHRLMTEPLPPYVGLAKCIVTLSMSLRELIAGYQGLLDCAQGNALDAPVNLDDLDDLPF